MSDIKREHDPRDSQPPKKIGKNKYRPYRKIFASVKNETFDKFKKRCENEGIEDVGVALSAIIEMYADGAIISGFDPNKVVKE